MLLAIALCLLCPTGDSQAAPVGAPARLGPPAALAEVRASRLAQPIAVDGVLAEVAWQQGVRVSRLTGRNIAIPSVRGRTTTLSSRGGSVSYGLE